MKTYCNFTDADVVDVEMSTWRHNWNCSKK